MNRNKLAAAALLSAIPLSALTLTMGAADAATPGPQATITSHVSDQTPASGQPFTVSGAFTTSGQPNGEQVVKVQAKQPGGRWERVRGASELTNSKGDYAIQVVLDAPGQRVLRVKGLGLDTMPNAVQKFAVRVH